MPISANTIIHYTDTFEKLNSIIESEHFNINYCLEKIVTRGNQNYSFAIAMVSFCDIPLSDYKKHFKPQKGQKLGYYGDYGIGLSKSWAIRKGLNPVLYIDRNSFAGTALRRSVELYFNKNDSKIDHAKVYFDEELIQFACYAKNYVGPLYRKNKLEDKAYKFYDEREWRYVPQHKEIPLDSVMLEEKLYVIDKDFFQNSIRQHGLKFDLSDIAYIIVNDEKEIPRLVEMLSTKIELSNKNKLHMLLTKIVTSEQIMGDF